MNSIKLISYNIWGQKINEGDFCFDTQRRTLITPQGKVFNIINDNKFAYKIQKNQIKVSGGINGLIDLFNEINTADSPFNPSTTNLFINL